MTKRKMVTLTEISGKGLYVYVCWGLLGRKEQWPDWPFFRSWSDTSLALKSCAGSFAPLSMLLHLLKMEKSVFLMAYHPRYYLFKKNREWNGSNRSQKVRTEKNKKCNREIF